MVAEPFLDDLGVGAVGEQECGMGVAQVLEGPDAWEAAVGDRAIQDHDVIAMGKHYVLNDQEHERFRANVEVDEQVMRELYLLPFEMLVKDAGLASIMSAYNRVRGVYATENHPVLTTILRDEWGFEGYVQSDFWSCRSAAGSLNAGMDLEMPDAKWLNETNVTNGLKDTSLEIETVDRALVRRFTQMFRFNQFDHPYEPGEIDAQAHGATARRLGEQMAILLKNDDGMLPLDPDVASVVVIGQSEFVDDACQGGGGSSKVVPLYTVPPVDACRTCWPAWDRRPRCPRSRSRVTCPTSTTPCRPQPTPTSSWSWPAWWPPRAWTWTTR